MKKFIYCIFLSLFFALAQINASAKSDSGASDVATMLTSVAVVSAASGDNTSEEPVAATVATAPESKRPLDVVNKKAHRDAESMKRFARHIAEWGESVSPSLGKALNYKIFQLEVSQYVIVLFVIFIAWLIKQLILPTILKLLSRLFRNVNKSLIHEFMLKLSKPLGWLIIVMGVNAAFYTVIETESRIEFVARLSWIIIDVLVFWILGMFGDFVFDTLKSKISSKYSAAINLIELGKRLYRLTLILFLLIIVLDLCGANVSAVLASLGIGGAALAFASKDTIANFFGSVSLVADRPFAVGDWIVAGNVEGVVETIGIRSTRVRTFPKTIVTIPNSILANESINNMSKMPLRRTDFSIGLTYSSKPEEILSIVDDIRKILIDNLEIDNNTFVVNFTSFGASSLDITIIYYARGLSFAEAAKTRQDVNIAIMKAVSARGLSFAFPSTSLYFENALPKA